MNTIASTSEESQEDFKIHYRIKRFIGTILFNSPDYLVRKRFQTDEEMKHRGKATESRLQGW